MSTRYITLGQVCDLYGFHISTARRLARTGELPARRIGKSYYVDPADLENWRLPTPTTPPKPPVIAREQFAEYIAKVVAEAPPLTADQVAKISTLLGSKAVA